MPTNDLPYRVREFAALVKQQSQNLAAAAALPATAGRTHGMSYKVGARVLDLITGEKGVVIDGYRSNEVVSPAPNQSR